LLLLIEAEAVTVPPPDAPDDYLMVDHASLVPLLTKAVPDPAARVADLPAQLSASPAPSPLDI
jgi:hypothetical protein